MFRKATLAAGLLVGAVLPAQAAPVTWDFVLTRILFCNIPSACHFFGPITIAELALPSDTSSGRTTFTSEPISAHPITNGDDFSFSFFGRPPVSQTAPPNGVPGQPTLFSPSSFDISWVATTGSLIAAIFYETEFDGGTISSSIGPAGNVMLASDTILGPLEGTQLFGIGDWRVVDEPSMLGLLGALGLGFIAWDLARLSGPGTPRTRETTSPGQAPADQVAG